MNVGLESFSHIRRRRDARFPHEIAVIMPGEYFVSNNPMVVYTVLGDIFPRKLFYFTETGRILLKKIERVKNRTIEEREKTYRESLVKSTRDNDVTLF